MKSRITIEVNFDEGNRPIIQIMQQPSDDVRDKLLQSFLQSLEHTSRWCKILYMGNRSVYDSKVAEIDHVHSWHIIPLVPKDIPEEIKLMEAVIIEKQHMIK